ncbi:hypothetical protein M2333_000185 [Sphingobium sp. B11D3B]|uniref:lytic transglycosylase domain-containing protein n=1 Tax=Sphingobium sp. B11D3B TaxID=2940575 RepID=UPI002226AFC2|nr:lytic transglycosylase domain-containing protein [Sphingobium sp. B11D3B]MCW2387139.1 hypothetical protein [Sphingobium sp. B11D3B]
MRTRLTPRCSSHARRLAGAFALIGAFTVLVPTIAVRAAAPAATVNAISAAHPYAAHVIEAAQRFGIPEAWIWTVMRVESKGDAAAISRAGAIGLMQIMPGTWAMLTARYGLGDNVWNVRANIHAGAAYLREMVDRYGDIPAALAAYNAGPGRVDEWRQRGRPLPAETVAYVAKVTPFLGTFGVASLDTMPAIGHPPAAPSWREATLFARGGDALERTDAVSETTPVAQPGGVTSTPVSPPSTIPPRSLSPASYDLFVPLSGRSEP